MCCWEGWWCSSADDCTQRTWQKLWSAETGHQRDSELSSGADQLGVFSKSTPNTNSRSMSTPALFVFQTVHMPLSNVALSLMASCLRVYLLVLKQKWAHPEWYLSRFLDWRRVWGRGRCSIIQIKTAKIMSELLARSLIYLFWPVWSPPTVSWQLNWAC